MKRLIVALTVLLPAASFAQQLPAGGGFSLNHLHAAPPSDGFLATRTSDAQSPGTFASTFVLHYADRPLQFTKDGKRVGGIVDGLVTGEAAASFGIMRGLEVNGAFPVALYQQASSNFYTKSFLRRDIAEAGLNDPRVGVKYRFLAEGDELYQPAVAAVPWVSFPLGSEDDFMGSNAMCVSVGAAAMKHFGPLTGALNLAYVTRPQSRLGELVVDDTLAWSIAQRTRIAGGADRPLEGSIELQGDTVFRNFGKAVASPTELLASVRQRQPNGLTYLGGLGVGVGTGYGAPRFRIVFGLQWDMASPRVYESPKPSPALDEPAPKPEPTPEEVKSEDPKPEAKPEAKPDETKSDDAKPEEKPEEKTDEKPDEKADETTAGTSAPKPASDEAPDPRAPLPPSDDAPGSDESLEGPGAAPDATPTPAPE